MLQFVLRKIHNKKWMIISLFIGNLLLISIVCASPIYSQAILQRTITTNLSEYMSENNKYPGNIIFNTALRKNDDESAQQGALLEESALGIEQTLGVPVVNQIPYYYLSSQSLRMEENGEDMKYLSLCFRGDIENHINITYGEMFSEGFEEDGSIGVIVSESTLIKEELFVGETYYLGKLSDVNGKPYRVTIKGVFENNDETDIYWTTSPVSYFEHLFMSEELFRELFVNFEIPTNSLNMNWTVQLDYTQIKSKNCANILSAFENFENVEESMQNFTFTNNFSEVLENHVTASDRLNVTIWVLQVPIYILLAAFIFMVSRQMLELEQSEIAVFKSRGASKMQLISIYLIQSSLISVSSLILGLPIGYLICQVLGSSNAFLEFVNRTALPAVINSQAIIYSLIATLFSMITMVIPVFKYANVGIVMAKRKKQLKFKFSWWEKVGLDIICIAVALYGWYSFNSQKEMLTQKVQNGENIDPVMFLNSSIFIIGAGLFALRLFPWIIRLIFLIGKKKWSPSLYVSFSRVIAAKDNQIFIMLFLIMTISLGIFNSVSARTINSNEENRIRYENGADIVIEEVWESSETYGSNGESIKTYIEPSYEKYSEIEGVESFTKVMVDKTVTVELDNNKLQDVTLMGIDTKEFGETAWFKNDLLKSHWYEYLNAISQNPEAVLMSSNAKEAGFEVGDIIYYDSMTSESKIRGIVYAFVDYWPAHLNTTNSIGKDGVAKETNNYLVVANYNQIEASYKNASYQVWIKMKNSSSPIYDFINANDIKFKQFTDTNADIISKKSDPIFQGTNGVLTVGFIVILALCAVGFLIYWILSIISRQLQFGIFRAMGMSMKEIIFMLVNEQVLISGFSILIGTIVGFMTSKLFVPIIEISYSSAEQSIPLEIVSQMDDNIRIFTVIGVMISICMIVIAVMISRLKIAQALKLGED